MTNPENLKTLTSSEAREIGRIGGIKSGEARRKKRDMKAELLLILDVPIKDKKGHKVPPRRAISLTLLKKALDGDLKTIKLILEIIGELPKDNNFPIADDSIRAGYLEALKGMYADKMGTEQIQSKGTEVPKQAT
jgi:hypothetical protein